MIAIIDYGLGNLGSVRNMMKRLGFECIITSDINVINDSQKIILPGVGSFDKGVQNLKNNRLWDTLILNALDYKKPILGICLGMQLMLEKSEEGNEKGFGWIEGNVRKFPKAVGGESLKIPHMGWNIGIIVKESPLFLDLYNSEQRYYFVHSYFVSCENNYNVIMKTSYGLQFDSAVQKENLFGVQFHPEKSHKFGMKILRNFCNLL